MKIGAPRHTHREGKVEYRVEIRSPDRPEMLWYRVDEEYGDLVSSRTDAALVALLRRKYKLSWKVERRGSSRRHHSRSGLASFSACLSFGRAL